MTSILIVEDDLPLLEGLVFNLERNEYVVEAVSDGLAAIETARSMHPDLILLDLMLPGLDGFQVCRVLRQEMSCPILMLTARSEEVDRVVGLELGADDYIIKPFSMRELLARIKSHLRHERLLLDRHKEGLEKSTDAEKMTFDKLVIDVGRRIATLDENPLALKPKEFDLLCYLAHNAGQIISRETLLEKVWGWSYFKDTHTVDVHIHWLRELIEQDPQNPKLIMTVYGSGYRFGG